MPFRAAYDFAFSKLSSSESRTNSTLFLSVLAPRLSIDGISARQGGHQVAQRFTNTFFPPNWERSTTWLLVLIILSEGNADAATLLIGAGSVTAGATVVTGSVTAGTGSSAVELLQAENTINNTIDDTIYFIS